MKKQKFFAVHKTQSGQIERVEMEGYKVEFNGFVFFIIGAAGVILGA